MVAKIFHMPMAIAPFRAAWRFILAALNAAFAADSGHSLDDDGASGFDQLPTVVSLNGDDGPCP